MKKLFAFMLLLAAFAVTGCEPADKAPPADDAAPPVEQPAEETPAEEPPANP
jgi:hypothetical protein